MKNFKGTPGEWRAKKDNMLSSFTTEIFTNSVDVVNIVDPIMRIKHNEAHISESMANAKLISAAPELLQNCIWCINNFKNVLPVATKEESEMIYHSLIENLEKAIHKATY